MKPQIHIIGGGISGLIAAQVLEDHGQDPIILEAGDRVGGRLRTDVVDRHILDHGFQVLLTAYPAAKKYLNLEKLDLRTFLPGSVIFFDGQTSILGDAARHSGFLLPTLKSNAGTLMDKWKVWRLSNHLKAKSLDSIFSSPEQTTLEYLHKKGFSPTIIERFFRPFYTGIFLENDLRTSSRMFEFVFKMFAMGHAALPAEGIEAIPKQLEGNLKRTAIHRGKAVADVTPHEIVMRSGETIPRQYIINATNDPLLHEPNAPTSSSRAWKSCQTLYYNTDQKTIASPMIGLVADSNSLINNICYPSSLYAHPRGETLLSVTVVEDHGLNDQDLRTRVEKELKSECGMQGRLEFLKQYDIPQALPELSHLKYKLEEGSTKVDKQTFLTGDTMLNASLNGAMLAGEQAAFDLLAAIQESQLT